MPATLPTCTFSGKPYDSQDVGFQSPHGDPALVPLGFLARREHALDIRTFNAVHFCLIHYLSDPTLTRYENGRKWPSPLWDPQNPHMRTDVYNGHSKMTC